MKLPIAISTIAIILSAQSPAQTSLFTCPEYSLTSTSVVQGKARAVARSRSEIISTYQSTYEKKTKREIEFKFSINGLDNEGPVAHNHVIVLPRMGGTVTSPLYVFGQPDARTPGGQELSDAVYLESDADLLVRVDMRHVLEDLKTKGFYETFDGKRIPSDSFKGVYIAGNTEPLSWDFGNLPSRPEFCLSDNANQGIYEVTVHFSKSYRPPAARDSVRIWKSSREFPQFPRYESPQMLVDALYSLALEELQLDTRNDKTFIAGALWPGVWTRDISYSILLALAIVNPDASRTSLLAKVKNDRIVQDTGTGGSWPVSSDRMVWALAAWEVYLVTGDREWLKNSFRIIQNSALDDMATVIDPSSGLVRGESSFLDWREQTYPLWMDPKDIYESRNLGTNAVHYQMYRILGEMASVLGEPSDQYTRIANNIKKGINNQLWINEKGYYSQYLYGRTFQTRSPKSESLGEALTVLFDIADAARQREIVRNTPATTYGMPCIFPQIPNIPPYHNDAVWPFVEAYWAWASAKVGNEKSVAAALASIYRAAGLFLTNKENMVAATGDFAGTEVNSDRQLWSIAGNLAMVYRVLLGMSFTADSLRLHPFVPKVYDGVRTLKNFRYRNATLTITVDGYGDKIRKMTLDGQHPQGPSLPANLVGEHRVHISMSNSFSKPQPFTIVADKSSPETPMVSLSGSTLRWNTIRGAAKYTVLRNGTELGWTKGTRFRLSTFRNYAEYQVSAVDANGRDSFLSEPIPVCSRSDTMIIQAEEAAGKGANQSTGYSGDGYLELTRDNLHTLSYQLSLQKRGLYRIDFRYANGSGPVNTDDKCAVRTLLVDGEVLGPIVMPQRGTGSWSNWGYSSALNAPLTAGTHVIAITYRESDNNMNREINTAYLDYVRFTMLK